MHIVRCYPYIFGHDLADRLMLRGAVAQDRAVLDTLLNIVGMPPADIARHIGLTRGRIGHYQAGDPVPAQRQQQLYFVLRGVTEALEGHCTALAASPEFKGALSRKGTHVAWAIIKACRETLAEYEAVLAEAA